MSTKILVRQAMLGMTALEKLCGRGSREIQELAFYAGGSCLPGGAVNVSVAGGMDFLTRSTAMFHRLEMRAVASWLPGLRNEALLHLGQDISNWSFDGTKEAEQQFWPMFYADRESVRMRVAPLLGCCLSVTTRVLRFHSQRDVECLTNAEYEHGSSDRMPRFIIDAHELAERTRVICGTPLFFASS